MLFSSKLERGELECKYRRRRSSHYILLLHSGRENIARIKNEIENDYTVFSAAHDLFFILGVAQFTASVVYFTRLQQTCECGAIGLEQRVACHAHHFRSSCDFIESRKHWHSATSEGNFRPENTINPKVANKSMEFIDGGVVAMETN